MWTEENGILVKGDIPCIRRTPALSHALSLKPYHHFSSLPPDLKHSVPGKSWPRHDSVSDAWLWMFTFQESLEKAQLLAVIGDQLIQSHHYAVDSIRPRCAELRHLCDDFINENKKKHDILEKSLELHRRLDKVSKTKP